METYTLTVNGGNTITATYPTDFDWYWALRTGYKLSVRDALKEMHECYPAPWNGYDYTDIATLARFRKLETILSYMPCKPHACKCPRCL